MRQGNLIAQALDVYARNLVIVVPMFIAVVADAILFSLASLLLAGLFFHGFFFIAYYPFMLAPWFLVFLAVFVFIAFVVNNIAGGVVADVAWRIVEGRGYSLEASFNYVKQFVVQLVVSGIIAGIAVLVLSVIPIVGTAIGLTLFSPIPLLVVRGRDAIESVKRSAEIVVGSASRRFEVPLVSFIVFLIGVAGGRLLQLLVSLLGYPYVIVLYALYMRIYGEY